jgi:hypothetical protein
MGSEPSDSPSAWRRRSGEGPAPARTNTVNAAVVIGGDVRPTLERLVAGSSGRLVGRVASPPPERIHGQMMASRRPPRGGSLVTFPGEATRGNSNCR